MTLTASVLIANLHSPLLGDVIGALRRQTVRPLEVIIVGQDRYGLAQDDGWVRVITTPNPAPPSAAINAAIAYARGEVLCFLDADCIPNPAWLERILELQAQGYLAICGGTDLHAQNYWQRCDNIACQGEFLITAAPGERYHIHSGNMALRRDIVCSVGLFDERFRRAGGEDTDYSFRIRLQGYRLYFDPRVTIEHHTNRDNPWTVWRHLNTFGRSWPRIARRYRSILSPLVWLWLYKHMRLLALLLIPALAMRDTLQIYITQPGLIRRYWYTFPGVVWARSGWYIGMTWAD